MENTIGGRLVAADYTMLSLVHDRKGPGEGAAALERDTARRVVAAICGPQAGRTTT
jgi:hypothetical protein